MELAVDIAALAFGDICANVHIARRSGMLHATVRRCAPVHGSIVAGCSSQAASSALPDSDAFTAARYGELRCAVRCKP